MSPEKTPLTRLSALLFQQQQLLPVFGSVSVFIHGFFSSSDLSLDFHRICGTARIALAAVFYRASTDNIVAES